MGAFVFTVVAKAAIAGGIGAIEVDGSPRKSPDRSNPEISFRLYLLPGYVHLMCTAMKPGAEALSARPESPARIVIIDEHEMVREGLAMVLARQRELEVLGTFGSAVEFQTSVPMCPSPDVILAALSRRDATADGILRVCIACPDCAVLALPDVEDPAMILSALRSGVRGYITKRAPVGDLLCAIRTVARGCSYVAPALTGPFLEAIRCGGALDKITNRLSPREVEVMQLVALGKSSKEVADGLRLEVETVRSYRKNLMRKLGVNNVASLTRLALSLRDPFDHSGENSPAGY